MPVPNHLSGIAYKENKKNNFTDFYLRCTCGCTLFDVYESYLNKEEKMLCRPYYDALYHSVSGGRFSDCTKDENGTLRHWIYFTDDIDGPKEEVIIPPAPAFAHIEVIKVRCSGCGKEYIVFDSRYNGYSGLYNKCSKEEKNYIPHFKLRKRRDNAPVEIYISVEHDESLEAFKANTEINCTFDRYTDSYTWIMIYSIDSKSKKRKLFEFEAD